jgi:hypothetical protein
MADGDLFPLRNFRDKSKYKPKGGAALARLGGRATAQRHGAARLRTRKVANMLAEQGRTPLETMADNVMYFAGEAKRWEAELANLPADASQRQRDRLSDRVKGYRLLSQACAKDAAPYCHPKLAAHYLKAAGQEQHVIVIEPGDELV